MIEPDEVIPVRYDERVEIPFGEAGITIAARPDQPRWLTAVRHDLHTTHTAFSPGSFDGLITNVERTVREVIFIDRSQLITAPTRVRRDDGLPSVVRVTDFQPSADARQHVPQTTEGN